MTLNVESIIAIVGVFVALLPTAALLVQCWRRHQHPLSRPRGQSDDFELPSTHSLINPPSFDRPFHHPPHPITIFNVVDATNHRHHNHLCSLCSNHVDSSSQHSDRRLPSSATRLLDELDEDDT
ncbi:hypothetical protein MN608_11366 [Microdochium nivale]|nr:hypothetical protein MN608_11366 [Microdochium nivale]